MVLVLALSIQTLNAPAEHLDEDKDAAMEKVKAVCEEMKPHRMKNRVTFYYLLAKNEGKLGEF